MDASQLTIEPPLTLPGDPVLPGSLQEALGLHRAHRPEEAETRYVAFLEANPGHPQALSFLGACYAARGQNDIAAWLLSTAIRANGDLADPRYCLGNALLAQGQLQQAVIPFSCALALGHPRAGARLEWLFTRLGDPARSASFRTLSGHYLTRNQPELALDNACKALGTDSQDKANWLAFRRCLTTVRFSAPLDRDLMHWISKAFTIEHLDYRQMSRAAISALIQEQQLAPLFMDGGDTADRVTRCREDILQGNPAVTSNALLLRLLGVAVVNDIELERPLTALRTAMLLDLTDRPAGAASACTYLPLLAAMASQCFLNEYIWPLSTGEQDILEKLTDRVIARVAGERPVPPGWIGILGAYQPLFTLPCAGQLADAEWPAELTPVIRMQLHEPAAEAAIRNAIPAASPITGNVSERVRSQYEENPFPRWATVPIESEPFTLDQHMCQLFPYLDAGDRERLRHPDEPEILVAGCGTGLIPNYIAANIKGARVTALDLSLSSLAYAQRKSRELGIDDVRYLHGDILKLPAMKRRYDHINCYGVLHHMENTLQGWQALVECIRPGGTMQIGLYSRLARRPVTRAHEFIRERGYAPVPDDMRRFRYDVLAQRDDPLLQALVEAPDFYSMSELRDLVFHSREQFHSLPEIAEMIESLGMVFLGFVHRDPTAARRYRTMFPEDPEMLSLASWDRFEAEYPTTFASIYDFWVYRPAVEGTKRTT